MKIYLFFLSVILILATAPFSYAGDDERKIDLDSVTTIEGYKHLYQSGDYYFGGQPSIELLKMLKSEGVTIIINLRTEKEMDRFEEFAYNEENMVKELGMQYFLLPVDGQKSYNQETLTAFAKLLDENPGKVFIHCGGCTRVTYLIMAYLIEYKNNSIDEVMQFGKQLRYTSPIEDLTGKEFTIQFNE